MVDECPVAVMIPDLSGYTKPLLRWGQGFALWLASLVALGMVACCVAAGLGLIPWPEMQLAWNGVPLLEAGKWAQIALTVFAVLIALVLPANARMARLEHSHRSFAINLEDVTRAYRIAHSADRAGVFALSGEFEAVRARLEHLRRHPDLSMLEPELLQLAAEMSFLSRDLARTYSDDRVARARAFLKQRQEEAEVVADRIAIARRTVDELRRWLADIEADELKSERQIKRLEEDLREILPQLGYAMELDDPREGTIVQLAKQGK